ncbi:putative sulfate exporter family transporter, partial [Methylocella silvestris]|uniref:putative sulfate exporter family transporter n=1 Tax=Methylocella silvestris TaxID=199596 RepID=UPI001FDF5493
MDPAKILTGKKTLFGGFGGLAPGVALCVAVTLLSIGVQSVEERVFSHPYVEALVIAILLGMAIRTVWEPGARWKRGIAFSAKQLLEVA